MKICYLDAFSGISGDMTVGALIDAGADSAALFHVLESLETGAKFQVDKVTRRGVAASKFHVIAGEAKGHRHLKDILELIAKSAAAEPVKQNAAAVFQRLGEAEAKVHGIPLAKVHFHEVGAVDSICDIVGACAGFHLLGVDAVYSSSLNVGSGTVNTELLTGKPVYARGPALELTTPTGAAIAATLSKDFGALPPMRISSTGYGAGDKDFPEHANVLRVLIGESSDARESTTVSVLEANIDDSSPQVLGYAMERLLEAGALDVTLEYALMKKNRPGTLVRVIAKPEDRETLAQMMFAETSTLGLRIYSAERRVQARRMLEVETPHGKVHIKISADGSFAPEYDDCRALALASGIPLKQILADANLAYLKSIR
jgi:uncharacterized protein (TIGR00299 family) protein